MQLGVETFELPRPGGQGVFKISLSRPPGLALDASNVPVVYVLDADIGYDPAVAIARYRAVGAQLPDPIVVGVGYGVDFFAMAKLRTADFSPPLGDEGRAMLGAMTSMIGDDSGGAEAFLAFILDTLGPEITRRAPQSSTTRRILFGHSLGGLFVAYALLTRPSAFPVFAISSPSLWWDGFSILKIFSKFIERLKTLPVPPVALVMVGALEQDLPTEVIAEVPMSLEALQAVVKNARMVDAAQEFAEELGRSGLIDVQFVAFADEDHSSVAAPALNRALTVGLKSWK